MESYNFVLPSHGNPIVLDWIRDGKAVFQPGLLETPCLVWKGARSGKYGKTSKGRAHRIAISCPENLHSLHSCDNPPCCNPWHLRYGTHEENMADYQSRGIIPLLCLLPVCSWSLTGNIHIVFLDGKRIDFESILDLKKFLNNEAKQ